jgi:transcriptional regulator with GAF, ATPase, and Fis domain
VHGLKANGWPIYDCMTAPDERVWRDHLLCDRRTPPPDQVAFRVDWSTFLAEQTDRTQIALAMLAAGHQQVDVADRLGITASAICQRLKRAGREWAQMQGEVATNGSRDNAQA